MWWPHETVHTRAQGATQNWEISFSSMIVTSYILLNLQRLPTPPLKARNETFDLKYQTF